MSKTILSPQEGISIIEKSLKQSSNQKTGAFNYYIIWGSILFLYYILQFFAFYFKNETCLTIANLSNLLFLIGGIMSFLQSKRDAKRELRIPINEKIYKTGWIAASIGLAVFTISNLKNLQEMLFIGVLLIFGLVNLMIGSLLNFKPLIIGALFSLLLTILIPIVTIEFKFLTTAIGILSSCLIPGLLMKKSNANV
jgi:hypothetical protein